MSLVGDISCCGKLGSLWDLRTYFLHEMVGYLIHLNNLNCFLVQTLINLLLKVFRSVFSCFSSSVSFSIDDLELLDAIWYNNKVSTKPLGFLIKAEYRNQVVLLLHRVSFSLILITYSVYCSLLRNNKGCHIKYSSCMWYFEDRKLTTGSAVELQAGAV